MYNPAFRRLAVASAWLAFLAATAGPTAASAQEQTQTQRNGAIHACREDSVRLCSEILPGGGRILACLQSHPSDLSPDCKGLLAKFLAMRESSN